MIWESNLVIFPSLLSVAMVILNWNLVSTDFFSPLFPQVSFVIAVQSILKPKYW